MQARCYVPPIVGCNAFPCAHVPRKPRIPRRERSLTWPFPWETPARRRHATKHEKRPPLRQGHTASTRPNRHVGTDPDPSGPTLSSPHRPCRNQPSQPSPTVFQTTRHHDGAVQHGEGGAIWSEWRGEVIVDGKGSGTGPGGAQALETRRADADSAGSDHGAG
jgi:hypothetical protein